MVTQGSGVVINMSSICSSLKGAERRFAYGTTKGAVIGEFCPQEGVCKIPVPKWSDLGDALVSQFRNR